MKNAILYIHADYAIYSNYSGPGLFQLVLVTDINVLTLVKKLLDNNYGGLSLPLNMTDFDEDMEENSRTVEYSIPLSKIKYVVIKDKSDIAFITKTFGTNFRSYDFIHNIFSHYDFYRQHEPSTSGIFESEIFQPRELMKLSPISTFYLCCLYFNLKTSVSMIDIKRIDPDNEKDAAMFMNLRRNYNENNSFPRSIDQTVYMPKKYYQNMQYYAVTDPVHVAKICAVIKKYHIHMCTDRVIEYTNLSDSEDYE